MKDIRLLKPDDIEVRIQSANKGGVRLLLYKNARVDMSILDETFGAMNWQRTHTRDNTNCIVSVWDETKNQWVSKEDTGTDSNMEAQKGRASDSFKRACFNWGIGRELYTAPDIFIRKGDLKTYDDLGNRQSCFDRFSVTDITYEGRTIATVTIRNESNGKVHTFGEQPKKTLNEQRAEYGLPPVVSQANVETLKKAIEKKGVSISLVLGMAGVESLEGITADEYNKVVKQLRRM